MQVFVEISSISWKLLDLLADYQEVDNLSAPELLSLCSCGIHMLCTVSALKKLKSTLDGAEINIHKENAKAMITKNF